jgi:hypothetical protein
LWLVDADGSNTWYWNGAKMASVIDESNPLQLLPDEEVTEGSTTPVHHLLRCHLTDCEKPLSYQADPTRDQAKKLAWSATLEVPFTRKPNS